MQIFILLYIEGGSYIVEDESTWEFVVLQVPSFLSLPSGRGLPASQVRETETKRGARGDNVPLRGILLVISILLFS